MGSSMSCSCGDQPSSATTLQSPPDSLRASRSAELQTTSSVANPLLAEGRDALRGPLSTPGAEAAQSQPSHLSFPFSPSSTSAADEIPSSECNEDYPINSCGEKCMCLIKATRNASLLADGTNDDSPRSCDNVTSEATEGALLLFARPATRKSTGAALSKVSPRRRSNSINNSSQRRGSGVDPSVFASVISVEAPPAAQRTASAPHVVGHSATFPQPNPRRPSSETSAMDGSSSLIACGDEECAPEDDLISRSSMRSSSVSFVDRVVVFRGEVDEAFMSSSDASGSFDEKKFSPHGVKKWSHSFPVRIAQQQRNRASTKEEANISPLDHFDDDLFVSPSEDDATTPSGGVTTEKLLDGAVSHSAQRAKALLRHWQSVCSPDK